MTLIPEAHDALADAVTRRRGAARPARRGRGLRASRRATGGIVVAAVVVSGAALAATAGWHPQLGGERRGAPPLEARAPVPAEQVRALAVLRRAQTPTDRAPEVGAALRLFLRSQVNGIHVDGIRVLRRHAEGATVLVPAERWGEPWIDHGKFVRRQVLCLVSVARSPVETGTPAADRSVSAAGMHCGDLAELRRRGILIGSGTSTSWRVGALVPDGVAGVVVRLRGDRPRTVVVRDNYWEVRVADPIEPPPSVRWLDAAGRVVHEVRPAG